MVVLSPQSLMPVIFGSLSMTIDKGSVLASMSVGCASIMYEPLALREVGNSWISHGR